MSLIRPMFIFFSLIFCITVSAQTQRNVADTSFAQKDTSYWSYNFRQFRDAVYQNDIAKAKSFIDLPFMSENNEIWYLLNTKVVEKMGDKVKPLTESDFVRYFNSLFPKYFIKCLLKVKTDELYKTGEYTTMRLEDSPSSKDYYWMDAKWDKSDNTLTLYLNSRAAYKDEDGEGVSELAIIYVFEITKKGHIKLTGIGMAG